MSETTCRWKAARLRSRLLTGGSHKAPPALPGAAPARHDLAGHAADDVVVVVAQLSAAGDVPADRRGGVGRGRWPTTRVMELRR